MVPVWDQPALRHGKSRITILSDLGCPIIVWTQSYMFVTESYWSGMVRVVGQALPTDRCVTFDFVKSDYNRDIVVTDSAVSDPTRNNVLFGALVIHLGFLLPSMIGPFQIKICQRSDHDHVKRGSNGCLPSASVHCLVTVGFCRVAFGRIGMLSRPTGTTLIHLANDKHSYTYVRGINVTFEMCICTFTRKIDLL